MAITSKEQALFYQRLDQLRAAGGSMKTDGSGTEMLFKMREAERGHVFDSDNDRKASKRPQKKK